MLGVHIRVVGGHRTVAKDQRALTMSARFTRYVAVGDSFTEGLEDVGPDGAYRGWADLVARHLAHQQSNFEYANLAVRGRRLAHVAAVQVPAALRMSPDLVTFAAGGNDVIRLHCDTKALGALARRSIARVAASGAAVIVFAGFNPARRIPMSRIPTRRAAEYNDDLRAAADETGAVLIDLWDCEELYDDTCWAPDRLHLSSTGHVLIARTVLQALGMEASIPAPARAVPAPIGPVHDLKWAAQHLAPWALRHARGISAGDGVEPKRPALAPVPEATASRVEQ